MKFSKAAEKIIVENLNVKKDERFFIITDRRSDFAFNLSNACWKRAEELGIDAKLIIQKRIDMGEPDPATVRVLRNLEKNDCLFFCTDHKIGNIYGKFEKGFRNYMRKTGARFATLNDLASLKKSDHETMLEALMIGAETMNIVGAKIKEIFEDRDSVEIFGISGTSLKFSLKGRKPWFNSGVFHTPGSGGNLPAGNISLFPIEDSVNGTAHIDIDTKVQAETIKLKKPLLFRIENGLIAGIEGPDDVVHLIEDDLNNFAFLNANSGFDSLAIRRIAEIGIGLIPGKPIGLGPFDSKLLGTAFIANGNTFGKGGKNRCRGHRDHSFWLKSIKIGKKILKPADFYKL